ncbi:MAG: IS1380 family transposase [bacterium]
MATTDCNSEQFEFLAFAKRQVVGGFTAGRTSSDGGMLLVREVAERSGILRGFAGCFTDHRRAELIEHSIEELVAQRVIGIACGYEDLNDHDSLRDDTLFAVAVGKPDLLGEHRARARDRGHALSGKSTLNRLELTPEGATAEARYKKIVYSATAIDALLVDTFLDAHAVAPEQIILDLDATDDPLHGNQEGRFFHGYYGGYCYLPLYITCGSFLLCSRLRSSNIDASSGSTEELTPIIARIRARWPAVEITIRGDSGFARENIMSWCEANNVHYVLGLAKNARLKRAIGKEMEQARVAHLATAKPARAFRDLRYRTQKSWSRERRVVGKAEHIAGKANPRFVVTSWPIDRADAATLYERVYCARGDMENRIKEQQLHLFADRTSTATMRANQLRLYFSSIAYVLMNELRRVALRGTKLESAYIGTIRFRLLKLATVVKVSVRRIHVAFSSVFPLAALYRQAFENIQRAYPIRV